MKTIQPSFWLSILILIISLACGTATGTPIPPTSTTDLKPKLTQPTATLVPTAKPESTVPAQPEVSGLALETYLHSSGYFQIDCPVGWSVEEEGASLSFLAPDDSGYIFIQTTNTIYELDAAGFEQFVKNREFNFFNTFSDYIEIDAEIEAADGSASVRKTITFDNVPQIIMSFYTQSGNIIFGIDFWSSNDAFDSYVKPFTVIYDTVIFDTNQTSQKDGYEWTYDFYGPDDIFMLEVPTPWRYERNEDEGVIVDTFYSPNDHAVIQNVAYDDGTVFSKSMAEEFALAFIIELYGEDITITEKQTQSDGRLHFLWHSPSGDYSGKSFYETRDTTFMLISSLVDEPHAEYYAPVIEYTLSTYILP